MISGSRCPAWRAFNRNNRTFSRLNPNWIDWRFDNVRTNNPAATSISRGEADLSHHQHLAKARAAERMLRNPAAPPGFSVPMPGWVKAAVDDWFQAANLSARKLFRQVNKTGALG